MISEHDKGVYDAMNKGILHANGLWLNFMNSGDTFERKDTLRNVFSENIPESAHFCILILFQRCRMET